MKHEVTAVLTAALVMLGQTPALLAQRTRGSVSRSGSAGNSTTTRQSAGGNASSSRTVSQTSEGYNVNKTVETQSGASKEASKDVNTEDRTVDSSSTTTNAWGQSASRERTVEGQGGYATVEGSASTSTGREASGQGAVGRNVYGQPAYAGTVNTKYNGNYATAGARNPYGGWTTATAGPYGGKVTTTLPAGYRTTVYHGRSYYCYGGAYYRPYTHHGVHYYYPVPVPYYAYYDSPPVGAIVLMVAGVAYLMSKDGSYSKQTTTSEGKTAYQSVPPPQGASIKTLPVTRVLVSQSGTTYYLSANAFYRRVMNGSQETFVVVTAPAGVVFVQALPADFEVVQLNTMYFSANGQFYVPYLAPDGRELYVMVDAPPQPPGGAAPAPAAQAAPATAPPATAKPPAQSAPVTAPAATGKPAPQTAPTTATPAAPATAAAAPAAQATPAVRVVSESLVVPAGALIVVRLASAVSPAAAHAGDRFQGFVDQDVAVEERLVLARGSRVFGQVTAVDPGKKLSVTLTDMKIGDRVVPVKTQDVSVTGNGGAAQVRLAFTVAAPIKVDIMTNVAVR